MYLMRHPLPRPDRGAVLTRGSLVIGVGNTDRGDDAAGVLVARALDGARVVELRDCSSLLDAWEPVDEVIVVDSMRSGRKPGAIVRFDGLVDRLPARNFPSTHSFGLAESLELGRALGRLPRRLTIYGIEGTEFGVGTDPSPAVVAAVEQLAVDLNGECG